MIKSLHIPWRWITKKKHCKTFNVRV